MKTEELDVTTFYKNDSINNTLKSEKMYQSNTNIYQQPV
jgi:hypothetical protein